MYLELHFSFADLQMKADLKIPVRIGRNRIIISNQFNNSYDNLCINYYT